MNDHSDDSLRAEIGNGAALRKVIGDECDRIVRTGRWSR